MRRNFIKYIFISTCSIIIPIFLFNFLLSKTNYFQLFVLIILTLFTELSLLLLFDKKFREHFEKIKKYIEFSLIVATIIFASYTHLFYLQTQQNEKDDKLAKEEAVDALISSEFMRNLITANTIYNENEKVVGGQIRIIPGIKFNNDIVRANWDFLQRKYSPHCITLIFQANAGMDNLNGLLDGLFLQKVFNNNLTQLMLQDYFGVMSSTKRLREDLNTFIKVCSP